MSNPDPRKHACDELAELLATPEGLRTARLLQLTEALEPRDMPSASRPHRISPDDDTSRPSRPGAEHSGPRPISIWQPKRHDGELIFERPEPHPLGDHYARRRTLVAAKEPGIERICFFGESAAAGYLYAPLLTPAEILEDRLCASSGEGTFDVVDLARTNETLDGMLRTLESSLQLDPDLLVIFAGNNWNLLETPSVSPYVPSVKSRQRIALALRRAGLAGLAELGRRDLVAKAVAGMALVAELARRRQTPVIVVVPEVNLAHWHDRQPVPWLPGDGSRRWHECYAEAAVHLEVGRMGPKESEAVLDLADAMLELDGGLCPTTHRLRAETLASLGRMDEARRACEAEVECGRYATQCFLSAPRTGRSVAELLRREAARHGFAVVDLPSLFAEHASEEDGGSPLPGHRFFLDYCHLSAEGMERAMTAVAEKVLESGDGTRVEVAASKVEVEPAVEALARLGAAVHGAHRLLTPGDKSRYLRRWCRLALAADPDIAETLRDLLVARSAPCPAVLTAAQQRNLMSRHQLLLQHGWRWDHLDVELILAICAVLEDAGHPVREEVEASLLKYHGVGSKAIDLSRPPYLWEPLERFYPEAMAPRGVTGRGTYRSPWPESSFCLIAGDDCDLELDLTVRLPAIGGASGTRQGEIIVKVDGRKIASVAAEESWCRHNVCISGPSLRRTIHRVTLVWPPLPARGDDALGDAIHRLENGVEADFFPVFGEVFTCLVRRC